MLKNELKIFFAALVFYTRIPIPKAIKISSFHLSRATRYFPIIGWITGAVSLGTLFFFHLIFPVEIAIIFSMISGIFLTGAFHEDGFADVCDGFGGGRSKPKILEIMKDSRIGTYGVTGLTLLLILKYLALKYLLQIYTLDADNVIALLLIFVSAHSVSRLAAISVVFTQPYVRAVSADRQEETESKIIAMIRDYSWKEVTGSFLFGLPPLLCLSFLKYPFIFVLIAIVVTRFLISDYFKRRIGGYTGDCLGATQQVCEL